MFVPLDIKQRITKILEIGITKAEQAYAIKIMMPQVTYNLTGTCGGTANYCKWVLDFNSTLLMENIEAYLSRTVLHELGHLVCDKVYPDAHRPQMTQNEYGRFVRPKREVHGPRWQSVMIVLGGPTTRCHSYDVSNVSTKRARIGWSCTKCAKSYQLGPKHHKALKVNPSAYKCKCSGSLAQSNNSQSVVPKIVPVYTAPAEVKVISATEVNTFSGSKIDMCAQLYTKFVANGHVVDRKIMINMFMMHAHCTPAGAATYFATLKKRYSVV